MKVKSTYLNSIGAAMLFIAFVLVIDIFGSQAMNHRLGSVLTILKSSEINGAHCDLDYVVPIKDGRTQKQADSYTASKRDICEDEKAVLKEVRLKLPNIYNNFRMSGQCAFQIDRSKIYECLSKDIDKLEAWKLQVVETKILLAEQLNNNPLRSLSFDRDKKIKRKMLTPDEFRADEQVKAMSQEFRDTHAFFETSYGLTSFSIVFICLFLGLMLIFNIWQKIIPKEKSPNLHDFDMMFCGLMALTYTLLFGQNGMVYMFNLYMGTPGVMG
jgi:hypothetical protein